MSVPPSPEDGLSLARTRRTLPIALLRAREAVMERFRPMLASHDVTEQQWRVMRVLAEADELDASRLAVTACVLAPSLTRMMRALEAKGFIHARKDAQDGRRTLVSLTDSGRAFIRRISPDSAAIYAEIERRLGAGRIDSLLNELESLLDALGEPGQTEG